MFILLNHLDSNSKKILFEPSLQPFKKKCCYINNKKGDISLEMLLSTSFILLILISAIYCSIFCYNNFMKEEEQNSVINSYNNIISQIKVDTKLASKAVVSSSSLTLFDTNSTIISKYELKDGNLTRFDKNNKEILLFDKIQSLYFSNSKALPNLISLRIFPKDESKIPFFTSFALRGIKK